MRTGVMVINFGEPAEADLEGVTSFLERIFLQNAGLERAGDPGKARSRARKMAEARAPGLIDDYRAIGGSPLNAQSDAQAAALQSELIARGHEALVLSCFQYTEPSIEDGVRRAVESGIPRWVGLPIYPLCGASTTVMALTDLERAVSTSTDGTIELLEVAGWHGHPDFAAFHADHIHAFAAHRGIDLHAPETAFLYSIHGTPIRYLEAGSRYDRYVEEACGRIAEELRLSEYHMGYQNHTNRPVEWTQPDVEEVVRRLEAERVVVHPVAFMHEQSETLSELDRELREAAEDAGLEFHRVPVPHDSPRFVSILADIVEARVAGESDAGPLELRRCLCRPGGGAHCTNGLRWRSEVRLPGT